jgi:hypothetical protein
MSTPGINTSVNCLRQVIKKLAELESAALSTAVDNISSEQFHDLDTELVGLTNGRLQLEYAVRSKWLELGGDELTLEIERAKARLVQLEQYFNYSHEQDHYELKPALFTLTNELFDLKRKLHLLEDSDVDFGLPASVISLLLRFKFINANN